MSAERKIQIDERGTHRFVRARGAMLGLSLALLGVSSEAFADSPSPGSSAPGIAPATAVSPAPAATVASAARTGFIVVALPGATDAAWPLATAIYGSPALSGATLDDAHARVLAGEPAAKDAAKELLELSARLSLVHGDDAASANVLAEIASRFGAADVLIVSPATATARATARVFLASSGTFDAAQYAADDSGTSTATAWTGALASLTRAFGARTGALAAPPIAGSPAPATSETAPPPSERVATETKTIALDATPPPAAPSHPKMFYESGWFWGAIGAAALAGTGVYFLTRDSGPSSIHLQMQVP